MQNIKLTPPATFGDGYATVRDLEEHLHDCGYREGRDFETTRKSIICNSWKVAAVARKLAGRGGGRAPKVA